MAPTCLAKQTANRESPQDWLVRMGIDATTSYNMWTSKQPQLAVKNILNLITLPLRGYPLFPFQLVIH